MVIIPMHPVYVRGWPRIFGVTIKDIEEGQELLSYYGDYSGVVKEEEKLRVRDEALKSILTPIQMEQCVDELM